MLKVNEKDFKIFMFLFLLFSLFGLYILAAEKYSLLIILPCIVFAGGILYAVRSFYDNIFLFCFLLCLFTFLLCGQVINKFMHVYGYNFSNEIEMHADIVLLISLIGLLSGYIITNHCSKNKSGKARVAYNTSYCKSIRYISKLYFYATYLLWILTLLDTILYVVQYGYASYYLSYSSRIPALIREIGYMAPVALYIFLAAMPGKKEARLPLIMYILYSLLSLGTGRRIHFMTGLLFVFAYMMFRNVICPEEEPWISKKTIIGICIAVPVLLGSMYIFEYVRSEYSVGTASQYSPVAGFFIRQGTSINVIKYTELFKDRLNPEAHYSLYNTMQWLQGNIIDKFLDLDLSFQFGKQSKSTASYGTYLADFVSYNANASIYLAGMGYGSCYIEELYVDFGYMGVFLGNVLYGFLLCKLLRNASSQRNIWLTAIGFFMVNELFKAPRATFDAFFGRFLYFSYWGPIVLIYIFVTLNHRRWSTNNARRIQRDGGWIAEREQRGR